MVHEINSEADKNASDIRQSNYQDLAPLVTPTTCDRKYITVTRQVALKEIHETLVLVSTQAAGLIEIIPHENVAKTHACVTAKGIVDVYPGRPFYITIANFGNADVH